MARPKIELKIDVLKVAKDRLFVGKKGTYLDCALFENSNGRDDYGQDGFITQKLSKEDRARGEKGAIIGNWKYLDEPEKAPAKREAPKSAPRPQADPDLDVEADQIPF